jgi:tetraacyldisaccharide 4'-kinase
MLAAAYRMAMRAHRRLSRARGLPRPVLSVGALSVGGAGKTPAAAWLTRALAARGHRPVLLSGGYRRAGRGIELVDAEAAGSASRHGDEPVWLARATGAPVVVGRSRWAAGRWALQRLDPGVLVLDDGFQHWRLMRDLDLVLLDASEDPKRLRLLPLGRYREGLEALGRAGAVLLTRCNESSEERVAEWRGKTAAALGGVRPHERVFLADLLPRCIGSLAARADEPLEAWRGRRVTLVGGIASPRSFEHAARSVGLDVVRFERFRDHVVPGARALARLTLRARQEGAEALLVTEKDAVKLESADGGSLPIFVLKVEMAPREPEGLLRLVETYLGEGPGPGGRS